MKTSHISNETSAKLLLALMVVIILMVFIYKDESTVEVDEKNKLLIAHIKTRFKNETHKYSFENVKSIHIRRIGKNIMAKYLVKIKLKNNKELRSGDFFNSYEEAVSYAEKLHSIFGDKVMLNKNLYAFIFNWM